MSRTPAAMFITLEGPEGSGKTTQVLPLADFLRQRGYDVLTAREPGGTPIGEQVRAVIFNPESKDMQFRTEILLFQAARAQLVEQVVRPHLAKGGVVLCDRYADSTLAYQGYGYQLDLGALRTLVDFATDGLKPDLTLLLDVDVETGLQRRTKGGEWNRLDAMDIAFYQRVRRGYHLLAQSDPQRWVTIDAGQTPDQVQAAIRKTVLERIEAGKRGS